MDLTPRLIAVLLVLTGFPGLLHASDWPVTGCDAGHTGSSPQELPTTLHMQWSREYPPLAPAWPEQERMQYDVAYDPIVVGQTLFLASNRHDCVRALDIATGDEKWTFFADGPVRFAPVVWEGKAYFGSDDGFLYCVEAESGRLLWKYRGGPSDRKILGNERIISTWPVRGAPVLDEEGTIYFAASIWPFMGIFIHALDARTGVERWTNDGDGSVYMKQPHNADAFASIAPQGALTLLGNKLFLPGGRSTPACVDRRTGKMLRYQLAENSKRGGGSDVAAIGKFFWNGGAFFDAETQQYLAEFGKPAVLTPHHAYICSAGACRTYDLENAGFKDVDTINSKGVSSTTTRWMMKELTACRTPPAESLIRAGNRLYMGCQNEVLGIDTDPERLEMSITWRADVSGKVMKLAAASDRLFAVTREGRIYCFAGTTASTKDHRWKSDKVERSPIAQAKAKRILDATQAREGYGVVWGIGDGQLARELVRQSDLRVIVVEPDLDKVRSWHRQWVAEDLYGSRISIVHGTPDSAHLPAYLASLMICEDSGSMGETYLLSMYRSLRPYGGVICFVNQEQGRTASLQFGQSGLDGATFRIADELALIVRSGALPGSGNWTHEHTDASNTRVSLDRLVKAPLGLLWFGGPSHEGILPRHGHGPQPQVIDGRMIIEGVDLIRAIDIYTGRLLWETAVPGVGDFYNSMNHQPGANASGSNLVSVSDGIYVASKDVCYRLDPATGRKLAEFHLPSLSGTKQSPRWGYLNVHEDYLIGGAAPNFNSKLLPPSNIPMPTTTSDPEQKEKEGSKLSKFLSALKNPTDNLSASKHLVVMDRHTGRILWTATGVHAFRHNGICLGGGRLYAIDRLSGAQVAKLKEKLKEGETLSTAPARIIAWDLKSGKKLWENKEAVFGTWLSYSEAHEVLVEAGRPTRDSISDEPLGMRAYQASQGGKTLWYNATYAGPAMIHHDTILQGQGACDLLTGKLKMRSDPITGNSVPWTWARNYGCNTPAASEHMLMFRSGAAGYFDYCNDGGTGNFGGFRSSCTNNLIVAGGLLTAPEYTRTCTCSYQNQSSIALIPMPEAEMWTYFGTSELKGTIRRLGLNLGAAGDRRAEDGTLWLEYPSIAGTSPKVDVTTKPENPTSYRRHTSQFEGPYNWVASSGLKGIREVKVSLGKEKEAQVPRRYTVRLIFAEPDGLASGSRLFDVEIQGKKVLFDFDIAKETEASRRSLLKIFPGIIAADTMMIRLTPALRATVQEPILSGIELLADDAK